MKKSISTQRLKSLYHLSVCRMSANQNSNLVSSNVWQEKSTTQLKNAETSRYTYVFNECTVQLSELSETIRHDRFLLLVEEIGTFFWIASTGSRYLTDAVKRVVRFTSSATDGKWWKGAAKTIAQPLCLILRVFTAVKSKCIRTALFTTKVPGYVLDLMDSYFWRPMLLYESDNRTELYKVAASVPRGTVGRPLLPNIMYNSILKVRTSGATLTVVLPMREPSLLLLTAAKERGSQ